MALSPEFVDQHISRWKTTLRGTSYAHRQFWPAHLFHHTAVENAVSILREGCLRSRNDPALRLDRDIAAPGVIANRDTAHGFVRMYFRPKTPTQYHIEGIRRPGECQYGDDSHAPILIMFVLDARKILTLPGVQFSDRNMQRDAAIVGDDADHFASIPFDKVFHEGPIGGDPSITSHRCAEVLSPSPLELQDVLTAVWFRSIPERDTLLHLLGADGERWREKFKVSDALKAFEKNYPFVERIKLSDEGIAFKMNPRRKDYSPLSVKIIAKHLQSPHCIELDYPSIAAFPSIGQIWFNKQPLHDGQYEVTIHIDGQLAYVARHQVENPIF